MKKMLFLTLSFSALFLFGCADLSDCSKIPANERDSCCAKVNKDTPHILCVGSWKWTQSGCSFVCTDTKVVNPASEYCEKQGNTLSIVKDQAGNEYGICKFPDGTECEEWDYYNSRCKPGDNKIAVPVSEEQCSSLGGKWGRFGLMGLERCNLPTKDGGNACTSGSQCQAGLCIANPDRVTGACPAWKLNFGCIDTLESGKVMALCID